MVSRKQFLQLSALSVGSLLIPSYFFSKNKNFSLTLPSEDINSMLQAAKGLCKEKKWQKAKLKYEQILKANPQEVRAYDGLRRCFFQKAKQESAYLQILEKAAEQFPNNKNIQQRLCSQYISIAVGNKKLSKLKNSNLLLFAQQKLITLQQNYPYDSCLQNQLLKVNNLIEINAGQLHHKKNSASKKKHKQNQKVFKTRFHSVSDDILTQKLALLKSKIFNKDREKHIRELYLTLINRKIKNKNFDDSLTIAVEYHNLYPTDKSAIYWIRRLTKAQGKDQLALQSEDKNHQTKQTFWSAYTYFSAVKKYQSTNTSVLEQLMMQMNQKKTDENQNFLLNCQQIDLLLIQNQTVQLENKINDLLSSKSGIKNTSIIDTINVLIIKYLKNTHQEDFIKTIPYIIANSKNLLNSPVEWQKKIAKLNMNRSFSNPNHMMKLQSYINKV